MLGKTKLFLFALAGGMSVLPLARPVDAGLVVVGGSTTIGGTTAAARPELTGTVVRDELIPFSVTGGGGTIFTGTLQDRVIRATDGTLTFAQSVRANTSLARRALLDYVRRSDFDGFGTDVNYRTDGVGQANLHPELVRRTGDGANVQFSFHDRLSAGQDTLLYFVKTNATSFDVGGNTKLGFIGRNSVEGSATLSTARPTIGTGTGGAGGGGPAAIPLPAAVAAFPVGALVAGFAMRRMRRGK